MACVNYKNIIHIRKKVDSPTINPLAFVHMDLIVSMKIESLRGKHYILLAVDGYSKLFGYSLHKKGQ